LIWFRNQKPSSFRFVCLVLYTSLQVSRVSFS